MPIIAPVPLKQKMCVSSCMLPALVKVSGGTDVDTSMNCWHSFPTSFSRLPLSRAAGFFTGTPFSTKVSAWDTPALLSTPKLVETMSTASSNRE